MNAGGDGGKYPATQLDLDGTMTDDGMPNPPGTPSVTWTKQSGPGEVTFANPHAVDTTATFSASRHTCCAWSPTTANCPHTTR